MAQLGVIWADGIWNTAIWNTAIWAQEAGPGDITAPTLTSATVASNGNSITLAFDESVSVGSGGNGGFTVSLSGGACTLTYSSGSGSSSLVYTTSRTVAAYEIGTLGYDQPGDGIEDSAGNDLEPIPEFAITNGSTVNTAPTDITLSSNRVSVNGGLNAVVGILLATDPDTGDTFTFILVAGTGDTDNAAFNINGNQLRCDDPETSGLGAYSVRVQVSDGTDTYAEQLTIYIVEPASSGITRRLLTTITKRLTGIE